jgi:broad specificity phosphatase PhoE
MTVSSRYFLPVSMIYLIRHGQASFGHDNYDKLSPLGIRQAKILAAHLFDTLFQPDAMYSGNMARQTATADEVISRYRINGKGLPELEIMDGFNEYDTAAIVTAMFPSMVKEDPSLNDDIPRMYSSRLSFKRIFEGAMLRWVTGEFDAPGVESWVGLKERISGALRAIMQRHGSGKTIAVFTSGGAIAASLSHVLKIPGDYAMRLNWQIINTSISRYMYNEERITLAGFNSVSHLELEHDPSLITYR